MTSSEIPTSPASASRDAGAIPNTRLTSSNNPRIATLLTAAGGTGPKREGRPECREPSELNPSDRVSSAWPGG